MKGTAEREDTAVCLSLALYASFHSEPCLCKCGIMSLTIPKWIECKHLDLWGKEHSLSFKSSFG